MQGQMFLKNIKKGHSKAMSKLEIASCACCEFAADSVILTRRVSKDYHVMGGAAAAVVGVGCGEEGGPGSATAAVGLPGGLGYRR
jgi:hypothetical protein